jgi:hypothetical protein
MKNPQRAFRNQILTLFLILLMNTVLILILIATLGPSDSVKASRDLISVNLPSVPMEFQPPLPVYLPYLANAASANSLFPNCRYGIATMGSDFDIVSNLRAGWYLDFGARKIPYGPSEAEFVQQVSTYQGKDRRDGSNDCRIDPSYTYIITPSLTEEGLGEIVDANPGTLWIVGNEPDRVVAQDDICPQQYAQAYHEVYHFIKGRDPTAKVAIAGLVEVTPGRLQYLDIVWDTYRSQYGTTMPVDVWTMHLYILPEATPSGQPNGIASVALGTNPALAIQESGGNSQKCSSLSNNVYCFADHDNLAIFADQIVKMRTWMKEHGQQNKPLILSEYSILYPFEDYDDPINPTTCWLQDEYGKCFTAARVNDFMIHAFDYLENATDPDLGYPPDNNLLVQQWLWFSLYTVKAGKVSNLITPTTPFTLTDLGYAWQNYVSNIPAEVNFFPAYVPTVIEYTDGATVATATLSVEIWNNGNFAPTDVVTVTFYTNQSLTDPIGSTTFSALGGCAQHQVIVTTTWEALSVGYHPFWVKVDSAENMTETNESDNVASGAVFIDPAGIVYLPTITRDW